MGSFRKLSVLPAALVQSASAWSLRTTMSPHPRQLFQHRDRASRSSCQCTSADITESIRHESQAEMARVSELVRGSPTVLIKSTEDLTSYLESNNIQNYLFDCDGVLYRGTDPMPGASNTLQSLLDNGKKIFFVTNNAASSRLELKEKLEKVMRLPKDTLNEEMMIGSAYVAAQYLRSQLLKEDNVVKKVHVIGTAGLCSEIQSAGFEVSGGPDPISTPAGMSRDELAAYPFPEGHVDAVVIGLDNDFNYRKLCVATVLLQRNPKALFVATNRDAFDLVGFDARHLPGNGALVSSVETASGRTATNVGKPSPVLAAWILKEFSLNPDETMMIGDRLDTDVRFGNVSGMHSALVLTGCTTSSEIKDLLINADNETKQEESLEMIPTIIFPHVGLMY